MGIDQAWIDVGGTFTDCYLAPAKGPRRRIKVLSTGLVPIGLTPTDDPTLAIAPELGDDAENFWIGASLRCYDAERKLVDEFKVIGFAAADRLLKFDAPILRKRPVYFELDAVSKRRCWR